MSEQFLDFLRPPAVVAAADPVRLLLLPPVSQPVPEARSQRVPPPDAGGLGAEAADPVGKLPSGTAVLNVAANGDYITVWGQHEVIPLPVVSGSRYGPPGLSLADLARKGGEVPSDICWRMRTWSDSHKEIIDWIASLRRLVGDDELRLIIWDNTGLATPWELLWIKDDQGGDLPAGWLGGLVPVVRWTTIYPPGNSENSYFTGPPAECLGEIAAYIGSDTMRRDLTALRRSGFVTEFSADELLDRLSTPTPGLGLVYVAAHGRNSRIVTEQQIGGLWLTSLSPDPLPGLQASRSLVFLNACHSAALVDDKIMNDSLLRGFVQAFIQQGATAVIGTTGAVGDQRARQVAAEVLDGLASDDRPHVAVVLRDARARASAGVTSRTRDSQVLLPFLYTYMYVCYGNARTSVRLGKTPA